MIALGGVWGKLDNSIKRPSGGHGMMTIFVNEIFRENITQDC